MATEARQNLVLDTLGKVGVGFFFAPVFRLWRASFIECPNAIITMGAGVVQTFRYSKLFRCRRPHK